MTLAGIWAENTHLYCQCTEKVNQAEVLTGKGYFRLRSVEDAKPTEISTGDILLHAEAVMLAPILIDGNVAHLDQLRLGPPHRQLICCFSLQKVSMHLRFES